MLDERIVKFFEKEYPMVKLVTDNDDVVIYDAKANFSFSLAGNEFQILIDFLSGDKEREIISKNKSLIPSEQISSLVKNLEILNKRGIFLKGPLKKRMINDRERLKRIVENHKSSILTNKFVLEVTEECNLRCRYCPFTIASNTNSPTRRHQKKYMSEGIARKAIDYLYNHYEKLLGGISKEERKAIVGKIYPPLCWYGGEPLLNFEIIKKSKEYFERLPWENIDISKSSLRYAINTNLTILTEEIIQFFVSNNVYVFVSLDGPQEENDKNRVFKNGKGSFETVYKNLARLKKYDPGYFLSHVSIQSVAATNHDRGKCTEFFDNLAEENEPYAGCFGYQVDLQTAPGKIVPPAIAKSNDATAMKKALSFFKDSLNRVDKPFKDKRLSLKNPYISKDVRYLEKLLDIESEKPAGFDDAEMMPHCAFGFDVLMVATNGDFHMCQKTDGTFPIGNYQTGIDIERIVDYYVSFNKLMDRSECRSCWIIHFCELCPACLGDNTKFFEPQKYECNFLRDQWELNFKKFLTLMEHKDLFDVFADPENKLYNFNDLRRIRINQTEITI